MATSTIKKEVVADNFRFESIATANDSGFHLSYDSTASFSAIYYDSRGRLALINHRNGENASISEIVGAFNSKSSSPTDVYLNTGNYTRMGMIIVPNNPSALAITVY